ncbi:DUF4214 domain-containing protein [Aquihabitans daechungensis]|uniref:DUF4214 domain-containing protein n=1 Tax=Aquihabitans daechungensis TaxID=1052257 RepID=UPI003B9E0AD0
MNTTAVPVSPKSAGQALRKAVMLLIAALIIGSGLSLTAGSASALTPGTPRHVGPISWDKAVLVAWSVPDPGGKPATQYKVERYLGDAAQPQKTYVTGGKTMWLVDTGLTNNTVYRYRIQAWNQDGASPWSDKEAIQPKPYRSALAPFEDADKFVKRQYQDLLGRQPNAQELADGKDHLDAHDTATFTDSLAYNPARVAERHPVIRLYFAFFKRSPDLSGANYWITKRKNGTNLNQIASSFAASSEFQNKYGNLSNSDFVKQIFVNVFDRQPDPSGHAYWTKKLDEKKATRGQVMVGFSESSEYKGANGQPGKSTGRVEASDAWMAIMKGVPTNNGLLTYYAPHVQGGGSIGSLAMVLMPTNGYPK